MDLPLCSFVNVILICKLLSLKETNSYNRESGYRKTYFGYYLLYLLALQNQTIVYDNANEAKPIVLMGKMPLKANDITHQNRLEEAISCIKEIIFDFIGESVIGTDEISHTIAHIYLDQDGKEPYTQVTVRFASDYLKQRVIDQYEARIREKLVAQIRAGIGSSLLDSCFEYIAHRILRKGGHFDVRPLDPYLNRNYKDSNAVVNLSLQNEILKFNKNSIDSIESQKYYQPKKKNFPSVDSIIASNRVFQMTISKNHPINLTGLNLLCDKLGGKSVKGFIYYYFVVPAHLYDDFKMQRFDVKNTPDWINKRVFQYALKIEL
ncbi:2628_t:CDS:2 [Funneliformis caledonium]|uniref:2628_t:CDS:1 n=1 Tax=Funneliformis caledonium TaxID=1117310 RepID=A0A9N9A7L9_9GLOM|nr:2628_t:CDS:2 [Funneliformis caledonium]